MSSPKQFKIILRLYGGVEIPIGPGKADFLDGIRGFGSSSAAGRARGHCDHQRATASVNELMDLGRDTATRATQSVIGRLLPGIRVVRLSPPRGPEAAVPQAARRVACSSRAGEHGWSSSPRSTALRSIGKATCGVKVCKSV